MLNGLNGRYPVLRRFLHETRSDTAVEFAMIGAAFFLFIFGIFVISIDQFWQMTLDDAVRNAARQVQIGKVTTGAQFQTVVCNEFGIAAPYCANSLQYSVQSSTYFGAITAATLSASGTLAISNSSGTPSTDTFSVLPTTAPVAASASQPAVTGSEQFLLVQVAYPLPFKILLVPGGVATENGTPSLLSTVTSAME